MLLCQSWLKECICGYILSSLNKPDENTLSVK